MKNLAGRLDFRPRYHLANALMRAGLAVLPACRVRDELKAILAAYRAGVEAVALLDAMKRLDFFTGEPMPVETVAGAEVIRRRHSGPAVRRVITPIGADGLTRAQRTAKIEAALEAASRETGAFGR